MKKIYLAGPDVFAPDAHKIGEQLKKLASEFGFIGLFPLDNEISEQENPYLTAKEIRDANLRLLQSADIVMANLNPFRGLEPDSGTVFEVGYGVALGKDVYAYASDRREMKERIQQAQNLSADATHCRDGMFIEDFQLSHNLMMLDLVVAHDARSCMQIIAKRSAL